MRRFTYGTTPGRKRLASGWEITSSSTIQPVLTRPWVIKRLMKPERRLKLAA